MRSSGLRASSPWPRARCPPRRRSRRAPRSRRAGRAPARRSGRAARSRPRPRARARRSASRRIAAATPSPRRSGSTASRPSRATSPRNSRRQVPITRPSSTATMCVASWSRPSRSASGDTPCSPQKTRSRSSSAAASSSLGSGFADLHGRPSASVAVDVLGELAARSSSRPGARRRARPWSRRRRWRGSLDAVEGRRDLLVGVLVVREGRPGTRQELLGVALVVVRVHAEEHDLAVALLRLALKKGNSERQGPHQDAHLFTTTGVPRSRRRCAPRRRRGRRRGTWPGSRDGPVTAPARRPSRTRSSAYEQRGRSASGARREGWQSHLGFRVL